MEPLTLQAAGAGPPGRADLSGRVVHWLTRPLLPQGIAGTRSELAWTATGGLVVAGIGVADVLTPGRAAVGALLVLPVLAASWMLGTLSLLVVLALAVAAELEMAALGHLGGPSVTASLVAVVALAVVGRAAAVSFAQVLRAREHEVGTLLLTAQLLGRPLDQAGVAAEAVRTAAGALAPAGAADPCRAALMRVAGETVTLVADSADAESGPGRRVSLRDMPPAFREAFATGKPAVVLAPDAGSSLANLLAPSGAVSWAAARVLVGGEPFGLLVAARDTARFRRDDLRLLDGIARVTGLAIGNSHQHSELAELKQRLQYSVELALEVGRSLEPTDVVGSILLRVSETVGADRATLARVDADGLVVESTYRGGWLMPVRRHFAREQVEAVPTLARALATGQPVITGPIAVGAGGGDLAAALQSGAHTLTFPLVVAGRPACLLVLSRTEGRPFVRSDAANLEPMADVALLALRNAHLYAQAEEAKQAASTYSGRLQLAIEAAEEIGSSNELSDVVERLLHRAVDVVRADRGTISRVEGGTLVLEHHYEPEGDQVEAGLRWELSGSPLAAEAIRIRTPLRGVLLEGSPAAPVPGPDPGAGKHVIQCPLLVEREVAGLLGLSRRRDEPFTDADLLTLQPFATLAALLLRNARLLAEARQVGRAKSAFLNLAAHELRTPLAVIKGYLSLLEDGTYPVPDQTREEAVDILVAKAQELDTLVEALLTAARLEVGSLVRLAVDLDVCRAVREAAARAGPRARLEGASIDLGLPEQAIVTCADQGHVARILDNLVNNALTYSLRPGSVTLEVRTGDPIEVVVRDRGNGIPADQQERVFERFHRVDGSSTRFTPGLGLGLSISRELAQANGGELVLADSVPGKGSTFVLRLPSLPPRGGGGP